MTNAQDLLAHKLKSQGYSITSVRVAIFNALEGNEPQSMGQLTKALQSTINRASIYRTVDLYEKLGIVQRLQIGWKYKLELSNEFQEHHHHLVCINCGTITAFREPENLHYLLGKIAEREHFTLKNHQLELQGLCAKCGKKA